MSDSLKPLRAHTIETSKQKSKNKKNKSQEWEDDCSTQLPYHHLSYSDTLSTLTASNKNLHSSSIKNSCQISKINNQCTVCL